jgi:hypothetical protein
MGEMMSLLQAVQELDSLDQESTIYASQPWTADSKVMVAMEPQSGGIPKNVEELGLEYFLEVFIAQEVLEGWIANLGRVPSTAEKTARLIQYATDDA